jgi:hypothetical protein
MPKTIIHHPVYGRLVDLLLAVGDDGLSSQLQAIDREMTVQEMLEVFASWSAADNPIDLPTFQNRFSALSARALAIPVEYD